MSVRYWRDTHFEAAHHLPEHDAVHGHSYRARLIWEGELDENGQLVSELGAEVAINGLRSLLDHRLLNDIMAFPTCENLALFILRACEGVGVRRVVVWRPTVGDGAEAAR